MLLGFGDSHAYQVCYSRGVWMQDRHVWICVSLRRRTYLLYLLWLCQTLTDLRNIWRKDALTDNTNQILLTCFIRLPVAVITSPAGVVAKCCDEYVCVCVCPCVCVSVCPRGYLRDHTRDIYQIVCACCLWP